MPRINQVPQAPNCVWVTLQKHGQSYRLSISSTLFTDNKHKYVSLLSCRHDEAGLRKAQRYQMELQDEITSGIFDPTLQKYESWKNRVIYTVQEKLTLGKLWNFWLEIKQPLLSSTTYSQKYKGTLYRAIEKIGFSNNIDSLVADKLFNYTKNSLNKADSIKLFNELRKACDRAIAVGLMGGINPFVGYNEKIIAIEKNIVNTDTVDDLLKRHDGKVAYSEVERDLIVEWFIANKPCYSKFIYFKFYTGCRFGEAVEVRWNDFTANCKTVFFRRSYSEGVNEIKTTKTGHERRFNCSSTLSTLLMDIKHNRRTTNDNDLIFKSDDGNRIKKSTISKWWYQAIDELIERGLIEGRLSQNHTRHTFNDIARKKNNHDDVAAQLGHSTHTADLHYTNRGNDSKVLDL
jgi:integrase